MEHFHIKKRRLQKRSSLIINSIINLITKDHLQVPRVKLFNANFIFQSNGFLYSYHENEKCKYNIGYLFFLRFFFRHFYYPVVKKKTGGKSSFIPLAVKV